MSGVGTLLSVATGGVSSLLGPLLDRLVDLIPDPEKKAQAAAQLQAQLLAADEALEAQQTAVNQAEAANENLFVSGWRPFVGWVCGMGLGWQIFVGPFIGWMARLCGSQVAMPSFDTGATTAILIPLLGLGAYRTIEKVQGSAGSMSPFVRATNTAIAQAHATGKALGR